MASCVNFLDLQTAIDDLNNPDTFNLSLSKQVARQLELDSQNIRQISAEKQDLIMQLHSLLSEGAATDTIMNKLSPDAIRVARSLTLLDPQLSDKGIKESSKSLQDLYDDINGSTRANNVGFLSSIANTIASKFVRFTNTIEHWAIHNYGMEGRNAGSNTIVQSLRAVASKYSGTMDSINTHLVDPWIETLRADAARLGYNNVLDFARDVGTYQIMRSMPERNDRVDQNLTELLKTELGKKTPDLKRIQSIMRDINEFRQYRGEDSAEILDKYGNPTGRRALTGGRTDLEAARWIENFHKRYNIDQVTMEEYGDGLTNIAININRFRQANGFMTPEEAQALEGFAYYIPVRTHRENATGIGNDATIYNPGNLHTMLGTRDRNLDDGFSTVNRFLQKAAMEYATRDLGQALHTIHNFEAQNHPDEYEKQPFVVVDYDTAQRESFSGNRRAIDLLEGRAGFTMSVAIPVTDPATGTTKLSRKLITFNPSYKDELTGYTGNDLAAAFKQVETNSMLKGIGTATSVLSSLNTHFNLMFAPFNMFKDTGERISSMLGQTYRLEDGTRVEGSNFIKSFVGQMIPASKFLFNYMKGRVDLDSSDLGQYYKEYETLGVKQEFDPTQLKERRRGTLITDIDPQTDPVINNSKLSGFWASVNNLKGVQGLKAVRRMIRSWNEYFNNVAPFAQYVALRRLGVTKESAAQGVNEILNFRETGQYTSTLQAIYSFAKPTMQGAAALMRSLGLAPNAKGEFKPNMKGLGYLMGTALAYSIVKSVAAGTMGEDEYDKLTLDDATRFIPIPLRNADGTMGVIKIPLPFGTTPLGFTLGAVTDRVMRNKMDVQDGLAHILLAALKNVQPAELPAFAMSEKPTAWFAQVLSPALIKPIITTATNTNYMGGTITYADPNSLEPMAMQGMINTPTNWGVIAQTVFKYTGLDLAPEQVRSLITGYAQGPARMFTSVINETSLYHMGYDRTTQGILGPWFSALGASIGWKKLSEGHSSMFHQEYDRLKDEIKSKGLNIVNPEAYKGDPDLRKKYVRGLLEEAGFEDGKIERFFDLEAADKDIRKLSRALKQKLYSQEFLDSPTTFDDAKELYDAYHGEREELYKRGLGL